VHAQGWVDALKRHVRYGGKLLGICGGFQMLGSVVRDPRGVEGPPGDTEGLGFLELETELAQEKHLAETSGRCAFAEAPVRGYRIHMGRSQGPALERPAFVLDAQPEGARSADDRVLGTYLHGLFDAPEACAALLRWAGLKDAAPVDIGQLREQSLDRLADATEPLLIALEKASQTSR
jgi:adenosylcobyric acid synthase